MYGTLVSLVTHQKFFLFHVFIAAIYRLIKLFNYSWKRNCIRTNADMWLLWYSFRLH